MWYELEIGINLLVDPSGVRVNKTAGNTSIYRLHVFHTRSGTNQSCPPEYRTGAYFIILHGEGVGGNSRVKVIKSSQRISLD